MRERDTPQREREMNLVPINYNLEDYELPDHVMISGILEIEIDMIDEAPYIHAFHLKMTSPETGRPVDHYYDLSDKDNSRTDEDIRRFLHNDKKLMDDIFDECAREGMWE
jgi:hypothetical protein